jgi:hypothetical protein
MYSVVDLLIRVMIVRSRFFPTGKVCCTFNGTLWYHATTAVILRPPGNPQQFHLIHTSQKLAPLDDPLAQNVARP